jgi:hypothetical protein
VTGVVTAPGGGWRIGAVSFTQAELSSVPVQDWDHDGAVESFAQELAGVVSGRLTATLTYTRPPLVGTAFVTVGR